MCVSVDILFLVFIFPSVKSLRADTDDLLDVAIPEVVNLSHGATITVNATCGQLDPEVYCIIPDNRRIHREPECGICDAVSIDEKNRHPISNAIANNDNWWQSPTLQSGEKYQRVTITIDLKQIFQISYVRLKAANSRLPGNWILERSIDGILYQPWQYFALSNTDCWQFYGIKPLAGLPHFRADDEVICTSYYSNINSLHYGEINISLTSGRPSEQRPSNVLNNFTKARFIRLRFQKLHTVSTDINLINSTSIYDRTPINRFLYYTLQDITIGGRCICNGHAKECTLENGSIRKCVCLHNTCGENCEKCCPSFNQQPYRPATKEKPFKCEACNCNGHSDECIYDANVAERNGSININDIRDGGGVCVNCRDHTSGNNCDQCIDGFYRPKGVFKNATSPCRPCQCQGRGTTNFCIKDDTHTMEGFEAGACTCKKGYTGPNCNQCEPGYRNYPLCESCTCHYPGIINTDSCDGPCICKINVEGPRCDRCKAGFYDLSADNPLGCSPCFCFGVTHSCRSSDLGIEVISSSKQLEDWRISDLKGTKIIKPKQENSNLVVADDEIPGNKPYYWVAPEQYLGDKLYSYGGDLRFKIGYTILRGDTSGYYTEDSDIILESDSTRIGYNWKKYDTNKDDTTIITLPLREPGWYILNSEGRKVRLATREEFSLTMFNLTRMLIRAKFHTDQVEGKLFDVEMEKASTDSQTIKKQVGAEHCNCPPGYTGLSCGPGCAPGYRRVNNQLMDGVCEKCNCNNHALSCDPYTGECSECLHNTEGPNCIYCKEGFYGNPLNGKEDDCKPCACPLLIPSNNFSPTCTLNEDKSDYICTQCRHPYTGDKCQLCKDGYYGDPTIPGGECVPCECGPNVDKSKPGYCDSRTGQCRCEGNTTGWKCTECEENYWGNPEIGTCKACECYEPGSLTTQCDKNTGQCLCKPNYAGRYCNLCAVGHGNKELGCLSCNCSTIGSSLPSCDPNTGQCPCRVGVFGLHCTKCLDGHYGFSTDGCSSCDCHEKGSLDQECDETTGQCKCHPFVEGRDCSKCKPGFWNIDSGKGCEPCNCNSIGSISETCDPYSGQCNCKHGVDGLKCDSCLSGYFGFSPSGCQKCDPCYEPNHICNPKTGKCECPPNTAGKDCRDCSPGTYGLDILKGCKDCECDLQGSVNNECHNKTGDCSCLDGFEGKDCSRCKFGYYRFPNCRRCDCHAPGTQPEACRPDGSCQCDESGQCPCRQNVIGRRCDRCREGTFSLSNDNPSGCFDCFCFERTNKCEQSRFIWTSLTLPTQEVRFGISSTTIEHKLGFNVIPLNDKEVKIVGTNYVSDQPYYWQLPREFLNDKVLSYNGFLRFRKWAKESSRFPESVLRRYPLVVLQGNHRLILYHFENETLNIEKPQSYIGDLHQIRLHETSWIQSDNPKFEVTRKHLMIALQKVQNILIRASNGPDASIARLSELSLEVATDLQITSHLAYTSIGVEECRCPPQYTGSSCQDPNIGYYRKRKPNYLDSKDPIDLVGWAEPCACNDRSRICDRETGHCFNCTGFTAGPFCDKCEIGYFGDPTRNIPCVPCNCPLPGHSFATKCETQGNDYICTECETGYTGPKCNECEKGYYGDPMNREICAPCDCSPYGSYDHICDRKTGKCKCKEGFSGRDCRICLPRHIQTEKGCENCDIPCIGILLDDLDSINVTLGEFSGIDLGNLPLTKLIRIHQKLNNLMADYEKYRRLLNHGKELLQNVTLNFNLLTMAEILYLRAVDIEKRLPIIASDIIKVTDEAEELIDSIHDIHDELTKVISILKRYGMETPGTSGFTIERLVYQAEQTLSIIKSRDFVSKLDEAQRELRKSRNLLDRVKALLSLPHIDLKFGERLQRLINLLSEITSIVQESVQKPVQTALKHIQESNRIKVIISETIAKNQEHFERANLSLAQAHQKMDSARQALIEAAIKSSLIPSMAKDLDNATQTIEHLRSLFSRLNPEYLERLVEPCQKHGEDLERQLEYLRGLFIVIENISKRALEAAGVYEKIVKALEAAENSAKKAYTAAEKAHHVAYPGIEDSLTKQASAAKEKSYQLLEAAKELRDNKVFALERDLATKRHLLDNLGDELLISERNIELINRALDGLPEGLGDALKNTDNSISKILENLGDIHSQIDKKIHKIEDEVNVRISRLQGGSASGIENLTRIIEKTREEIQAASRLATNSETMNENINKLTEKMDIDLTDLKHRILLSRQKAGSVFVSMGASINENCYHSYVPKIQPSSTNTISIVYAIRDDVRDSLLLFISSTINSDFMCVEMIDRRIRFTWNAGSGAKSLDHPLLIERNDQNLQRDHQWYKIDINRINNVVTLDVRRMPDSHEPDKYQVTGSSDPKSSKMDLDANSNFFIGGLPKDFIAPSIIRTRKFTGCIWEVYLDGRRVGLWNFKEAIGCNGCSQGASPPRHPGTFQFRGIDSYTISEQIKRYENRKYLVALQFKTFDENCLIFFSGNMETGDFVSVTLMDGRVVYQVNYGSYSRLLLKTRQKYNKGQWIRLAAEKDGFEAVLSVDDEILEANTGPIPYDINLKDSLIFFAGVTPNFTREYWPTVDFTSFIGCMKDVQIDTTPLNLLQIGSNGLESGCKDSSWKSIVFDGKGYVELNSHSLEDEVDFGFTFRTNQSDTLLLLSTFQGKPEATKNSHYYSLVVIGGHLEARFNAGSGETILISELKVDDGLYHTVTISKRHRRISMTLDDNEVAASRLVKGTRVIKAPTKGGLYLGGMGKHMSLRGMAGTKERLIGVIRDFVFSGKLIRLDKPVSFEAARIGKSYQYAI